MNVSRKIVLSASVLGLAVATPVAFSEAAGVEWNDACAQNGTCCDSTDKCIVGGKVVADGYWYTGGGKCPPPDDT